MEQKYCKRCNATKNSDEFNGINEYCIRCLEKERGKYRRNKEKKQEHKQKYYVEHKDEIKEQHRKYNKDYKQIEVWCDICKCVRSKNAERPNICKLRSTSTTKSKRRKKKKSSARWPTKRKTKTLESKNLKRFKKRSDRISEVKL